MQDVIHNTYKSSWVRRNGLVNGDASPDQYVVFLVMKAAGIDTNGSSNVRVERNYRAKRETNAVASHRQDKRKRWRKETNR